MKYKSFPISEDEKISVFLEEHKEHIARDSIAFLDGRICIVYDDRTQEELEKASMLASGRATILQWRTEMLGADVDERYWRRQALKGNNKKAENIIIDTADRLSNLRTQIQFARAMLKEIEEGTWDKDK